MPRNPSFTGREGVLSALHTQLHTHPPVALTPSSALHGLGGVGKTQIALEYAYRYGLEYRAVFWMGAETEEQMRSSLLRMAEASRARQALALLGEQEEEHALAQRARSLSSPVPAEAYPAAVARLLCRKERPRSRMGQR